MKKRYNKLIVSVIKGFIMASFINYNIIRLQKNTSMG